MLNRQLLENILQTIQTEYESGVIVSERHLQAIFYSIVSPVLKEIGYTMLIEPKIYTEDNECNIKGLIPDILIVKEREVCAIIEIKYVPHGFIEYQKDFETFKKFHLLKGNQNINLYLKVIPINGNWDKKISYKISNELKTYYVAIGNSNSQIFTDTDIIVNEYLGEAGHKLFQKLFLLIHSNKIIKVTNDMG